MHKLEKQGTLADKPRSGRPRKFTDAILKQAYDIVAEDTEGVWTTPTLLQHLHEEHGLELPVDHGTFLERLKEYAKARGHQLDTTSTHTIFMITPTHAKARLAFCTHMLQQVKTKPLDRWWFEDETQLAERAHHKGDHLLPCMKWSICCGSPEALSSTCLVHLCCYAHPMHIFPAPSLSSCPWIVADIPT